MTLFRCDKGAETEYTANKIALKKRDFFGKHTKMHISGEQDMNKGIRNILEAMKVLLFSFKTQPCAIEPHHLIPSRRQEPHHSAKAVFTAPIERRRAAFLHSFASTSCHDQSGGRHPLYGTGIMGKHAFIPAGRHPAHSGCALPRSA